ncbi:MFS family permease [Amycolatopsis bartoniae]|uniref:MFS transporter n=1 Tax=Amycolatopsis bartoniae TaxID=941986 RepID=A0A8H9ITU0_9PSEU|nr:MFS transporter [Amycolatopsis bartoniae]MBB2939305.1 MFS family permease [Amycolatopsis bartoniae]TVT08758.1 MFS transporter [Amycolatopsis bartoniae]GHF37436.1 MFS transporter [Amycolatopsis bartoniae]
MRPTAPLSTSSTHWDARLWGVLLTVSTVVGLDALDVSMVGVALPAIRADLGLSTSALQWVVSGYVLGYGGLLLLGGRAADLLGRRRVFLVAVTVFAFASLLGGLVDSGALLIATRFVKGLAAAFTAPAALSIITTTFHEGPARNRAISIFAVFGASGYSAGLVFSGLLTEVGWRWTFLLPVPVALAALAFGSRLIPAYRAERTGGGYDLPGAITGAAGSLLLVFAVVEAPEVGWAAPRTLVSFVVAAALLAAFVLIERRSRNPLLRLGILRSGPLARANLGGALFFGAYIGFQFVVMLYLQSVLGWSALQTALGFLPAALIVAFASPRIEPLIDRVGTPRTILAGVVAHVAGYALFLRVDEHSGYAGSVLPSMILLGIGFTLAFSSLNIQATTGIGDDEQGLAGGLLNTSLQVGGAIGLAVVTAVLTANGGADASAASLLTGLRPALSVVTGIAVLGLLVAISGVVRRRRAAAPVPAVAVDELV